jgi:hypothetical protein
MRAKLFSLLLLVSTLMVGCATRQPFDYPYPAPAASKAGSGSLAIQAVVDHRGGSNELDKVLFIPSGLDRIVDREVESTGRFANTVQLTNGVARGNEDFLLDVTLRKLEWEIPNHDQMVGIVFGLSLVTGGVGGVIYGSTSTDVMGHAQIAFKLSRPSTGKVLLEREYTGDVQRRVTKFNCDTPKTGRRLAGAAVRNVMEQFNRDLDNLVLNQ